MVLAERCEAGSGRDGTNSGDTALPSPPGKRYGELLARVLPFPQPSHLPAGGGQGVCGPEMTAFGFAFEQKVRCFTQKNDSPCTRGRTSHLPHSRFGFPPGLTAW